MNLRLILCLLFPVCLWGQSPSTLLSDYSETSKVEKLYIAHDKPFYIPGDIIWAQIWMIDGISHKQLSDDDIVYVDWVDPNGQMVSNEIVNLSKGQSGFSIQTQRDDLSGNYTLRAYTLFQIENSRQFIFQKSIKLINTENPNEGGSRDSTNEFELQFFPEGGYLINGLRSKVAFEIRDTTGIIPLMDVDVIDSDGTVVASSTTNMNGAGSFSLQPTIGNKYWLRLRKENKVQEFQLPMSLAAGAVMSVEGKEEKDVAIGIHFSENIKGQKFKLIGHVRGVEVLQESINTSKPFNYRIPRSVIPSGVVHFTLFDAFDRAISERLIFNRNPNEDIAVDIQVSDDIQRGESISGKVGAFHKDAIVPSSVVMSVYNANLIDLQLNDVDIENYLLLQSDLPEPIPNLYSYFDRAESDYLTKMDLLMMTQYWRRFNWLQLAEITKSMQSSLKEESYIILGRIVNRFSKNPTKADVILTAMGVDGSFVNTSMVTGDDGLFVFRGLELRDTTEIFLQAGKYKKPLKNKKKKDNVTIRGDREVEIEWIRYEQVPLIEDMTFRSYMGAIPEIEKKQNQTTIEAKNYITSYDLEGEAWSIDLESITISANQNKAQQRDQVIRNRYKELGLIFVPKSEKHLVPLEFLEGSYHLDIFEVIARIVPNAQTMFVDGQKTVSVSKDSAWKPVSRNRNALEPPPAGEPLFMVNGMRLDRGLVGQVDPESLLTIDIIDGYEALLLYNSKMPVYNLLLREDVKMFEEKVFGKKAITFPGYHDERTFYRRANVSVDDNGKDYSTSLYWNPDVSITDSLFEFDFMTSDLPGRHCIYIQGLTETGIPFVGKKYFVVE